MIFVARQLQEKAKEQHRELHMVFIDLTKAFDSVNREALWLVLSRLGCPRKFVNIIRQLHEGMEGRILHEGSSSDIFPIRTGVKQGCILAPTLFSSFLSAFLSNAIKDLDGGVALEYRIGGLLNIRRFEAKTKVSLCVVTELQYADDLTLVAHSIGALQCLVNAFVRAYRAFGLQINVGKTEVLSQYTGKTPGPVYVGDEVIQQVDSFKYLGSLLTKSANIDFEVDNRISCAAKAFSRLRSRVFDSHELSLSTKCAVYRAVVIPTLLYACETWVPYKRHVQKLETFHLRQLRTILNIKWQDKVTNDEVLTRAKCSSITSLLPAHHLRWVGHLNRMGDERLPKKILYGQIKDAPRRPGGQKKRFKDVTREHLKKFGISLKEWEATSHNRTI